MWLTLIFISCTHVRFLKRGVGYVMGRVVHHSMSHGMKFNKGLLLSLTRFIHDGEYKWGDLDYRSHYYRI